MVARRWLVMVSVTAWLYVFGSPMVVVGFILAAFTCVLMLPPFCACPPTWPLLCGLGGGMSGGVGQVVSSHGDVVPILEQVV